MSTGMDESGVVWQLAFCFKKEKGFGKCVTIFWEKENNATGARSSVVVEKKMCYSLLLWENIKIMPFLKKNKEWLTTPRYQACTI
jgi:hypothetical protein